LMAVGAMVALAACGSDPADPRTVSAILPTQQSGDGTDEAARNAAEAAVSDRCVRRHGFKPPAPPTVADFSADARAPTVESAPYGPATVEDFLRAVDVAHNTRAYAGGTTLAAADARLTAYTRSLPIIEQERYTTVVFGDETDPKDKVDLRGPGSGGGIASIGGCLGVAYKTLYGDPARWVIARELMGSLPREVRRRVEESETYRAATDDWRACVRGRGIAVRSFRTAAKLAVHASDRQARMIARAVIECRRQAGIDAVARSEERTVAQDVAHEYESDLLGYLEMRQRANTKARAVLEQAAG
jgi:hypothetical protein